MPFINGGIRYIISTSERLTHFEACITIIYRRKSLTIFIYFVTASPSHRIINPYTFCILFFCVGFRNFLLCSLANDFVLTLRGTLGLPLLRLEAAFLPRETVTALLSYPALCLASFFVPPSTAQLLPPRQFLEALMNFSIFTSSLSARPCA